VAGRRGKLCRRGMQLDGTCTVGKWSAYVVVASGKCNRSGAVEYRNGLCGISVKHIWICNERKAGIQARPF